MATSDQAAASGGFSGCGRSSMGSWHATWWRCLRLLPLVASRNVSTESGCLHGMGGRDAHACTLYPAGMSGRGACTSRLLAPLSSCEERELPCACRGVGLDCCFGWAGCWMANLGDESRGRCLWSSSRASGDTKTCRHEIEPPAVSCSTRHESDWSQISGSMPLGLPEARPQRPTASYAARAGARRAGRA